jgi:hypothetical protein
LKTEFWTIFLSLTNVWLIIKVLLMWYVLSLVEEVIYDMHTYSDNIC